MPDADEQSEHEEPASTPHRTASQSQFTRPTNGLRAMAAVLETRQQPAASAEEIFAENMKTLRNDIGLSQEALAELMSTRGFKWHQATVYKIENGGRQVQLGEAAAVAAILRVPLDRLTEDTESVQAVSKIRAQLAQLDQYDHELWKAATLYEGLRETLEHNFYELPDSLRDLLSEDEIESIRERIGTHAARIASDQERAPF